MTPSKLKSIYNAFRNSELKYNRHKVKLSNAYAEIMSKFAKEKDWENFDIAASEAIHDVGKSFEFTKCSIEVLYKRTVTI